MLTVKNRTTNEAASGRAGTAKSARRLASSGVIMVGLLVAASPAAAAAPSSSSASASVKAGYSPAKQLKGTTTKGVTKRVRPQAKVVARSAPQRGTLSTAKATASADSSWSFVGWTNWPARVGGYWKVSRKYSGGYWFRLWEAYTCNVWCSYEGPTYLTVFIGGQEITLGQVIGGQLVSYG